jgi:4-diphosphocytidyl-2-C-methyl-D-erythritol kinase
MHTIVLKARGKINLTLDVVGKRENGYHDLEMIMQTINLADTIKIKKTKAPGIRINTNFKWLPKDERNIAYKAAALFLEKANIECGVYIDIYKKIPVAAGLAGGSSDAAAVLVGLNRIFETGYTREELMEMGLALGADVPFCIARGTMLAEGIGEQLTPLEPAPFMYVVLAKPSISVSTKLVYQSLNINAISNHPNTQKMIEAIEKQDIQAIANNMANVLEEVTIGMHPQIEHIKSKMIERGAIGSMMSGSGPTVFGLFTKKETALKAASYFKLKDNLREVFVTSTYIYKHTHSKERGEINERRNK